MRGFKVNPKKDLHFLLTLEVLPPYDEANSLFCSPRKVGKTMRFFQFVLLMAVYVSSLAGAAPTNPNSSLILRVHDGAIELPSNVNELQYPCTCVEDKALGQVFEKYGVYSITRELSDIPKFKNINGRLVRMPDFSNIYVLDIRDENQVDECKKELDELPRSPGCEKLSAQERYRVRRGIYRIIYEIKDDVLIVLVVKVGHRGDVYRDS